MSVLLIPIFINYVHYETLNEALNRRQTGASENHRLPSGQVYPVCAMGVEIGFHMPVEKVGEGLLPPNEDAAAGVGIVVIAGESLLAIGGIITENADNNQVSKLPFLLQCKSSICQSDAIWRRISGGRGLDHNFDQC